MRAYKLFPILVLTVLVGLGLFMGVKLALKEKRPKKNMKSELSSEKSLPATEEAKTSGLTGVLRKHQPDTSSIVIYNPAEQREEGYVYDLATSVKNVYDKEIVIGSLLPGSILDLSFGEDKRLFEVKENKEAWDYEKVQNLRLLQEKQLMEIGERQFYYDAGLTVMNGKEEGRLTDVLPSKDVLRVRGLGDKVLSLFVTRGHGSIDFINYDEFIGGTIEIGYDIFDEIKENMTYTLREGSYKLVMKNGGLLVNKVIEIERNRIKLLDLALLRAEMEKKSEVSFQIKPSGASLSIDGREIEARRGLKLPYGEYIVKVTKDGYKESVDVIKVERPKETFVVSLAPEKAGEKEASEEGKERSEEKEEDEEDEEESTEPQTLRPSEEEEPEEDDGEKLPERRDESKKINFLKPLGATVSFDDKVVGVIPFDMVKITGEHKITLEKDGYSPVSYTVDIADDGEDAAFSFPELTD